MAKVVKRLDIIFNTGKPYTCNDECPMIAFQTRDSVSYLCTLKHGTKERLNTFKKDDNVILMRTNYCLELVGKSP